MRRIVLIAFILIIASFSVFADFNPHENGDKNITLQAYYKGQNQSNKAVSLTILDSSSSTIYQGTTTTVTFSDTEQSSFTVEPIFSWVLVGEGFDNSCSISLKFTFKALMAYVDGYDTYYVPGHEFTMTSPVVTAGDGSTLTASNISGDVSMGAFPAKTGDYQYPDYNNSDIYKWIKYIGTMNPDENNAWQATGACNLNVTSYSALAGIAVDYKGDVKVEFTVQ